MALTINPAVSGVTHKRWTGHVALFAIGAYIGALATYAVARLVYLGAERIFSGAWLAVALPVIALCAMRDFGLRVMVPYPARRQVPEWLRRVLPPGLTALAYGAQLGTGFLTRFTFSTHAAFVALLATQRPSVAVVATGMFAITKSVVVVASLGGTRYEDFEDRIHHRHRLRGQAPLRVANAVLALMCALALVTNI